MGTNENRKNCSKNKDNMIEDDDSAENLFIRFKRLQKNYDRPLAKVYFIFYTNVLPPFTQLNLFLQLCDRQGQNVYLTVES